MWAFEAQQKEIILLRNASFHTVAPSLDHKQWTGSRMVTKDIYAYLRNKLVQHDWRNVCVYVLVRASGSTISTLRHQFYES